MKEYWTDTILESLGPAGKAVMRGEPVRIYKADDVADLAKRCIEGLDEYYITLPDKDNPNTMGRQLKDELEQIAKIPLTKG